jgi:hypothetical protein
MVYQLHGCRLTHHREQARSYKSDLCCISLYLIPLPNTDQIHHFG